MDKTEMMKRYEETTYLDDDPQALIQIIEYLKECIQDYKAKATAYDRLMSMNSLSKNDIKIVLYGKAWCAYRIPFRNQQEEDAGFGVTPQIALTALLKSELPDGWEEK